MTNLRQYDFGEKLEFALKIVNVSRGRLAAEIKVDKSLVSRWLRGLVTPSDHNLATLTQFIRSHKAGFTQLNWELPLEAFALALGSPAGALPPRDGGDRPQTPGWFIPSRQQSVVEVAREGDAYPGVYAAFRQSLRNTGAIEPEIFVIWRERGGLCYSKLDAAFTFFGEVFILRHQLTFAGAAYPRTDGIVTLLVGGVMGTKAWRLHGLMTNAHSDRFGTPGATPVVMQRIADLASPTEPPEVAVLEPALAIMSGLFAEGRAHELAAPEIVAAVTPVIGVPRADGKTDYLLTVSSDRSLAASELDWSVSLETDILRLRRLLLGDRSATAGDLPLELVAPARPKVPVSAQDRFAPSPGDRDGLSQS